MRRSIRCLLLIAALGAVMTDAPRALAQPAAARTPPQAVLEAADRARALEEIEARIGSTYVFPERRAAIVERLTAGAASGRYDTPDPIAFAQRVSDDLLATTKDTHLYLRYEPDWFS